MHYLAIYLYYKENILKNSDNKTFFKRHSEKTASTGGDKIYVEDFYINQQRSPDGCRNFLRCLAYGESFWHKYQYHNFPHRHNTAFNNDLWWSFEFITDGNAEFISAGVTYKACPGDIIIMRPQSHNVLRTGTSGFLRKKCLLLASPLLDYLCGSGNLAATNHVYFQDIRRIAAVYDAVKEIIIRDDCECTQDISVQAYALLNELNIQALPLQYPETLCHALAIIDANPYSAFTLASLGEKCGASVRTLSRLFKNHLKTSPMNYIIERRLEQAALLLNISNMPLKEIADRCGYESASFFSRSFKSKYGMSPIKFRNLKLQC
jgi:AraC-like DNA-binding protein